MQAKYIERNEIDRTLAVAETDEHRAMLLLSYCAGLRAMEIAAMDWSYITTASGTIADTITLPALATKGATGAGAVPMNDELRTVLAAIHTARCWPRAGSIFARPGSPSITSGAVQQILRKLYSAAGLRASSHSGRRAFVTDLLRDGETMPDVKRVSRHSSLSTVAIYCAPSPTMRDAINRR
jgi:integrase